VDAVHAGEGAVKRLLIPCIFGLAEAKGEGHGEVGGTYQWGARRFNFFPGVCKRVVHTSGSEMLTYEKDGGSLYFFGFV
jgi:hypothetical protein